MTTPTDALCMCKDRPAKDCPGEWEPGCDLGSNEKFCRGVTPTDFAAWKAKAMELADIHAKQVAEAASFGGNPERSRAALEAHLDDVPMGEPVAYFVPADDGAERFGRYQDAKSFGNRADWRELCDARGWAPLYCHPKDSA